MADTPTPSPDPRSGGDASHPTVLAPTPERRDAVVEALTQAFTVGRIELEEFELRTERAMRATTIGELDASVADLLRKHPPPVAVPNSGEFVVDHQRRAASRLTLAIMSGTDRKGRWVPSRRHVGIAWMGGAFLDFREAALRPGVTDVYLITKWGGIEVAVPEGLDVEVGGFALMGGLERVSQESGSTDPRRPQLRIHALAIMGGIEVRVLKQGEKWEAKEDDQQDD